jgi:hypothetical protein
MWEMGLERGARRRAQGTGCLVSYGCASLGQDASLSFVVRGRGMNVDCRFSISDSKKAEKRDFTVETAFSRDLAISTNRLIF